MPEYQGKGIAKKLIGTVEDAAILEGCDRVTLDVRIVLKENIKFFRSLGYSITKTESHEGFTESTYYEMAKNIH